MNTEGNKSPKNLPWPLKRTATLSLTWRFSSSVPVGFLITYVAECVQEHHAWDWIPRGHENFQRLVRNRQDVTPHLQENIREGCEARALPAAASALSGTFWNRGERIISLIPESQGRSHRGGNAWSWILVGMAFSDSHIIQDPGCHSTIVSTTASLLRLT